MVSDITLVGTNKTKRRLATALKSLLKTHSFDSITVTTITDECDLSRQTFYRHFLDKYDLVNWIYGCLIDQTIRRIGPDLTWEEAVAKKLEIMKDEQDFYSEVYKSNDYNALLNNDAQIVHDYYLQNILRQTVDTIAPEDDFLLWLYCHGATRMTAHWARNGMVETPQLLMKYYREALPPFISKLMKDEEPSGS